MTNNTHTRFRLLLLMIALLAPLNAWSVELGAAKAQGLVGEQADGYLGIVVGNANAEIQALVKDVNQQRRAKYQRIAEKNGIALSDVETLAGQKAFEKTQAGNFVKPAGGGWRKK